MMTRREFISATAAAVVAGPPSAGAQTRPYELIIRGGRVIDPSARLDAIRDVAIAGGRIAAVTASIAADAPDTSMRAASSSFQASSTFTRTSHDRPMAPRSCCRTA